jgi:uncharacterized membrane protein YczE
MRKCIVSSVLSAVPIVAILVLLCGVTTANADTGPLVCVTPDSLVVAINEIFSLNIEVNALTTELMGYNIAVAFDSSIITLQSVTEGTLPLGSSYPTFFEWLNPPPSDSVHVNGAILGNTVDGPGTLFTLTFKGADLEVTLSTYVTIVFSILRDGVNQNIVHTVKSGWVRVEPPVAAEPRTWGGVKALYGDQ